MPKKHHRKLLILGFLGLLQGFIGWWMVKSGLTNRTAVSQYRLLIHLGMALVILVLLWQLLLEYWGFKWVGANKTIAIYGFLVILSGALVAGLRAGYIHQNFPFMGDGLIPADYIIFDSFWQNWGENPASAQLHHRILAMGLLLFAVVNWVVTKNANNAIIIFLVVIQAVLGILTLYSNMQIIIATTHQCNAVLLLLMLYFSNFKQNG